jgi:dTDP-glucose 4,6-dehydratase
MRVLVAGGAGFIGRTMCRAVLDRGDEVICVDNIVTGSKEHVTELSDRPGYSFIEADICGDLEVDGPLDAVVDLACPASPADFGPLSIEILNTSSRGVANLLELARRSGARFMLTSTSEVYGDPLVHPQPETYWGNVNPIGPRSVYDEAKRFAESLTMAYHRRYGQEVRIARIFNTYGPGMRADDGRVVSNFVTQALRGVPLTVYGDGSQTRSLCYVEDERTVKEIAELVIELTGSKSEIAYAPLPADDPTQRRPDLTVARREIAWAPATSLREGLTATIEWFSSRLGSDTQP